MPAYGVASVLRTNPCHGVNAPDRDLGHPGHRAPPQDGLELFGALNCPHALVTACGRTNRRNLRNRPELPSNRSLDAYTETGTTKQPKSPRAESVPESGPKSRKTTECLSVRKASGDAPHHQAQPAEKSREISYRGRPGRFECRLDTTGKKCSLRLRPVVLVERPWRRPDHRSKTDGQSTVCRWTIRPPGVPNSPPMPGRISLGTGPARCAVETCRWRGPHRVSEFFRRRANYWSRAPCNVVGTGQIKVS